MSGNSDILREISRRLAQGQRFAVLYPDIDSFKSYNDHYGFLRGDDVIKTLATIILEVLEENHSAQHFAGHVGGDDFVVLTEPSMAEMIATEITKRFDEAIPVLYDPIDRDRGWIESEERSLGRSPLQGFLFMRAEIRSAHGWSPPATSSTWSSVRSTTRPSSPIPVKRAHPVKRSFAFVTANGSRPISTRACSPTAKASRSRSGWPSCSG